MVSACKHLEALKIFCFGGGEGGGRGELISLEGVLGNKVSYARPSKIASK